MRPATPKFLAAIAQQHTIVSKATVTPPNGGTPFPLPITDGSVTLDATTENRGSCEITLADESLVPMVAGDPLTPYGSEIRAFRGIRYPDGTEELVQLFVGGVDPTDVNDDGASLDLRVDAIDRSKRVANDTFDAPYQVPKGTLFTEAIAQILDPIFPGLGINSIDSPLVTPIVLAVEEGADRWELAQNMAMAIACDLYYDGDGVPTIRPNARSQSVATLAEGEGGVLLQAGKTWTGEGLFNHWIVTGENSGQTPARGEAFDNDPQSPTFYGGPFGKVTRREPLSLVLTDQQAKDVAEMLKAKQLGASQAVNFGALVNPALEPDDVVQVTRKRAGIDELHVIDSLTIPLTPDQPMTGQTRTQVMGA